MTAPLDEKGLLPCPFCNDPMKVVHGTLSHVDQGDCPIGAYAWGGENAIAAWNRRAYLSAVALPDELGVAGWVMGSSFTTDPLMADYWGKAAKAVTGSDQAHSTIAALRAEVNCDPDGCKAHIDAFMQRAEAAEAEVTRLTEEKEALRAEVEAHRTTMLSNVSNMRKRAEAAEARIKALEEALRPFAEAAGYYAPEDYADEQFVVNVSTVTRTGEEVEAVLRRGDYRRARAALNSREKAE